MIQLDFHKYIDQPNMKEGILKDAYEKMPYEFSINLFYSTILDAGYSKEKVMKGRAKRFLSWHCTPSEKKHLWIKKKPKIIVKKKVMKHAESRIQSACVAYFRTKHRDIVIFAIPNGSKRKPITGSILKREGVLAGVADLFIMAPRGGFHGLFIEMKTKTGRQTESQKLFQNICELEGYAYRIARSLDDFMQLTSNYLALKDS
jgi:hypothetical protein